MAIFGYHDDVVLGHVLRQLLDEAPVGGFLARDDHVWRQHLQRLGVGRKAGRGRVGPEHQHPLHPRLDAGQVEVLQRGQRPLQKAVDDVDGSLLDGERGVKGGVRRQWRRRWRSEGDRGERGEGIRGGEEKWGGAQSKVTINDDDDNKNNIITIN